jgi:hypothetical protein
MTNSDPTSSIGLALLDSVARDNLTDMSADMAEALLDTASDASPLLEAIPIFGSLVKMVRAGLAMRDRLFLRQLYDFLQLLTTVTPTERQAFAAKMAADPKHKQQVGESLLLLLNRLDDLDKSSVLGKLFRAYLQEQLDYPTFSRLAGILGRAFLPDLQRLTTLKTNTPTDDAVAALVALGLAYQSGSSAGHFDSSPEDNNAFSITPLGQLMATFIFA